MPEVADDPPSSRASSARVFRSLDFDGLWRGRDVANAVERGILETALDRLDRRRILELGTGAGRLLPTIARRAGEYVGADLVPEFLERAAPQLPPGSAAWLVESDLRALPFRASSMSAAVMARVYNFLDDPVPALREIHRVLIPGGRLFLSYHPRPTPQTLVGDLKVALTRPPGTRFRSMTFSRASSTPVQPTGIPATVPTRRRFREVVENAGFRLDEEFGSGFEDSRPGRWLPVPAYVALGRSLGQAPGFPLRWVLLTRPAGPAPPLPPLDRALRCPRCGVDLPGPPASDRWRLVCPACGESFSGWTAPR